MAFVFIVEGFPHVVNALWSTLDQSIEEELAIIKPYTLLFIYITLDWIISENISNNVNTSQ